MNYKMVLIVKGSDEGKKAARLAAKLAKEDNIDTIHLLFVNDTNFYKPGNYVNIEKELEEGLKNIGRTITEKLTKIIHEVNNSVKVEKIELSGKTAEEILKFVKENQVDTLIIPKEERGPIEKSLVGGEIGPFINDIKKHVTNCIIVT